MMSKSLRPEIREKILKLFKELDVPGPVYGWNLCSDKKILEMYDSKVRGIATCESCRCEKKVLREAIDDELFEDIVLGSGNEDNKD